MGDSNRSIIVTLKAKIEQYKTGMKDAAAVTADVSDKVKAGEKAVAAAAKTHAKSATEIASSVSSAGRAVSLAGAGIVGALGLTAKAAIDWESAWTGVTKTVNGSSDELAGLEGQLRQMARTIPASQSEIAGVAEAAGQLGVKTGDIGEFTRVMIDLGNSTNLSADEAATSLAQLMNVMGTSGSEVSRLGATVVQLGNNGASTERDIVQMAQRIAGAGKQVGLSEAQVLAYASALSSVGIDAEAGGTAISQSFLMIDSAVRTGGAGLQTLADTAGMTAAQFKQAYQKDAAGAVAAFVKGLGEAGAKGEDVTAILGDLGISGIRQSDALRRLAASGTLLADSLADADKAWVSDTALAQEALKRYDTAASKIEISWNKIRDAAITAGGAVLPVVTGLVDQVGVLADAVRQLPPGLTTGVASAAGVIGVSAVLTGGLMQAGAQIVQLRQTWQDLSTFSGGTKLQGAIKGLGAATVVTAAGFAALQIAQAAWARDADSQIKTASDLVNVLAAGGDLNKAVRAKTAVGEIGDLGIAFTNLKAAADAPALAAMNDFIYGKGSSHSLAVAQVQQLDKALTSLASTGSMGKVSVGFRQATEAAAKYGFTADDVRKSLPQLEAQLRSQASAVGVLNLSDAELVDWMGGKVPAAVATAAASQGKVITAYDQTAASIDDVVKSLFAAESAFAGLYDAETGYYDALDKATAAIKENGRTTDVHTEKGRANRDALSALAEQAQKYTEQMAANGKSTADLTALVQQQRDQFIKTAVQMGMSKDAAAKLADQLGLIPSQVATRYNTPGADEARGSIDALLDRLSKVPPEKQTAIKALIDQGDLAAAKAALDALTLPRGVTVRVATSGAAVTTSSGGRATAQADGSLLRFYANGGYENHVAQFAPAGSWRIWAEPETGGEAYIPLSPAKRSRSLDIWRQTGRALGVMGYADGGIAGSTLNVPSVSVAPPNVGVHVYLDGELVDHRARVVFGEESAKVSRQRGRATR